MKAFKTVANQSGFSLVELIVTVAIASMLGGMATLSYDLYVYRAQVSAVTAQSAEVELEIDIESEMNGWYAMSSQTGTICTSCAYFNRSPSPTDPYLISQWLAVGQNPMTLDPWGTPLVFTEAEGAMSATNCQADVIISAGPNKVINTLGLVNGPTGGPAGPSTPLGDDIIYTFKRQRMPACNGVLL